ncbi:LAQU0S10e01112g1_1 [Lachancea quebecensis]|uniref:Endopolyphosphatase n=1 Tax=Lachancea quebecensis TaxID=1654605 RepID=A0A0P1KW10_9SACH|nr:LAQU0S10e01112g1_1 [Lachancea quebecensis]
MSEKKVNIETRRTSCRQWRFRTLLCIALAFPLLMLVCVKKEHLLHTLRGPAVERLSVEEVPSDQLADHLEALGLSSDSSIKIMRFSNGKSQKLHGRFLHITDIHPDPLYRTGSSIENVCHRGQPDGKEDEATRFGTAMAGCDSSMDLMEYTLKWIENNLRDKIDFVVWTGDNIRHDNDRNNPRTEAEIFDMNAKLTKRFEAMFRNPKSVDPRDFDVSIVPSVGNNDVFPHNLFSLGPTLQTREFYNMWANLVPEDQQRAFARDTSFFVEVIPGKLAVLSINTLYLYKANPLVDNCNSKKQPGFQLLLWLGYVLEELRTRGMKVWLTGHVPPLPKNFDQSCYDKYTLWTNEYRDVIIGGLYGHMNMDHFVPVDGKKSWKSVEQSAAALEKDLDDDAYPYEDDQDDDEVLQSAVEASDARLMGAKPVNKNAYMDSVREGYYKKVASRMGKIKADKKKDKKKKKKKKKHPKNNSVERYSIVNVAGSVIPTFNPAFRVWEYNTTGLEGSMAQDCSSSFKPWDAFFRQLDSQIEFDVSSEAKGDAWGSLSSIMRGSKEKKVDKTIPKRMPSNLKPGPGYAAQLFSPTRFVQYYADLETIEKDYKKALKLGASEDEAAAAAFKYQVEYCSDSEPYSMKSLLAQDYIDLAVKLAHNDTMWEKYTERAFCSTGYDG